MPDEETMREAVINLIDTLARPGGNEDLSETARRAEAAASLLQALARYDEAHAEDEIPYASVSTGTVSRSSGRI